MQIFSKDKTYPFMNVSPYFLVLSLLLMVASLFLLGTRGLNYGIDFSGGTLIQVKYDKPVSLDVIRQSIAQDPLFRDASVTKFGSDEEVVIRFSGSTESVEEDAGDVALRVLQNTGEFEIRRVDMVGPKVGAELREKGVMALVVSIIAILAYIAYRFEWRFAIAAIVALVHDISIVVGALVLFRVDINLDILAALLTILGYSLNDTIIVFDRIRESTKESKTLDLKEVINYSVSQTLSRTLLTSLTTFFVVLTLFSFGGEIIHGFGFTLLVGILVGTYSSIFVASPTLQWLRFDVRGYKNKEAEKEKRRLEKEKMRAQYERGVV
jgi:preprotein translocase subunit SecF